MLLDCRPIAVEDAEISLPYMLRRYRGAGIDPLREKLVMSLHTIMGWRRNLLSETPEHASQVMTPSPILFPAEFRALQQLHESGHTARTVSCLWSVAEGDAGIELGGNLARALDDRVEVEE